MCLRRAGLTPLSSSSGGPELSGAPRVSGWSCPVPQSVLGAVPLEPLSELGYLDLISQSWNFQSETHWDGLG